MCVFELSIIKENVGNVCLFPPTRASASLLTVYKFHHNISNLPPYILFRYNIQKVRFI